MLLLLVSFIGISLSREFWDSISPVAPRNNQYIVVKRSLIGRSIWGLTFHSFHRMFWHVFAQLRGDTLYGRPLVVDGKVRRIQVTLDANMWSWTCNSLSNLTRSKRNLLLIFPYLLRRRGFIYWCLYFKPQWKSSNRFFFNIFISIHYITRVPSFALRAEKSILIYVTKDSWKRLGVSPCFYQTI